MSAVVDPAHAVVTAFIAALRRAFNPDDAVSPPSGGGTRTVRFFAGDAPALAAFEAHAQGVNCGEPFVWVRVIRRYRSDPGKFPAPMIDTGEGCGAMRVVAVEVGVGRCAVVDATPSWNQYDTEADVSLEDSYRIELAMCIAATELRRSDHLVGIDTIEPYGPEGGVVAQMAKAYVNLVEEP